MKKIILAGALALVASIGTVQADTEIVSENAITLRRIVMDNNRLLGNEGAAQYVGYALNNTFDAQDCQAYWPNTPTVDEVYAYKSDCSAFKHLVLTKREIHWVLYHIPVWRGKGF